MKLLLRSMAALKMRKFYLIMVIFLLSVFSTLAINLSLEHTSYDFAEIVKVNVTNCLGTTLLLYTNPFNEMVAVEQGNNNWISYYNTNSDFTEGNYTITGNCADGTTFSTEFCVGDSCPVEEIIPLIAFNYSYLNQTFTKYNDSFFNLSVSYHQAVNDSNKTNLTLYEEELDNLDDDLKNLKNDLGLFIDTLSKEVPKNQTLINLSKELKNFTILLRNQIEELLELGKCDEYWQCSNWSECDDQGQKHQVCSDLNNCSKSYNLTQDCYNCLESWECSAWDTCQNGLEKRTCEDIHYCGTSKLKPDVERTCQQTSTSGVSTTSQQSQQTQPPTTQTELPSDEPIETGTSVSQDSADPSQSSSFSSIMLYLIIGVVTILLIVGGVLVYLFVIKPKLTSSSFSQSSSEINSYVQTQREKGISDDKIKQALLGSGWEETEINKVFRG